jgi:hypothetical protein
MTDHRIPAKPQPKTCPHCHSPFASGTQREFTCGAYYVTASVGGGRELVRSMKCLENEIGLLKKSLRQLHAERNKQRGAK